jgi:hypothetical protein
MVFQQRQHITVLDGRRIPLVENGEVNAVEAGESGLGAEPEIAVARLDNGLDGILRQALFSLPDIVIVLGNGFAGIERAHLSPE